MGNRGRVATDAAGARFANGSFAQRPPVALPGWRTGARTLCVHGPMRLRWLPALLLFPAVLWADLAEAVALYQARRYAEAQAAFEAVVAREPENAEAQHYLGRLGCLRQDLAVGLHHLERAAALRPDDPEIQFDFGATSSLHADRLGFSLRALHYARQGRRGMERAVELAPEVLRYRHALMEFYSRAPRLVGGSIDRAYAQGEAILARDRLAGTYALAHLDLRRELPEDALARWQSLLDDEPDHVFALFEFGRIAAESGRQVERGVAALRRCLELPPPDGFKRAQALRRLAQLHLRRGETDRARETYRAALALEPDNRELADEYSRLEHRG